jgi:hypothetical protein
MIDASGTSSTSNYLAIIGPLCGVALGAGLTWLIQRNEWGRQRRWELRRDMTLDAVRALADLEDALMDLNTAFQQPKGIPTEEAQVALTSRRFDAMQRFRERSAAYKRANIVIDLSVGGDLSKRLSEYFQLALPHAREVLSRRESYLKTEHRKELALRENAAIMAARDALRIKDAGELPLLDESN